jgi:hypothetical protein
MGMSFADAFGITFYNIPLPPLSTYPVSNSVSTINTKPYLIFKVTIVITASNIPTIQNLVTILGSGKPFF